MPNSKLDPKILRIGDRAKIINPEIFVRCGYPLGLNDIRESQEFKDLMSQARGFFESKFAKIDKSGDFLSYDLNIKGRTEIELNRFVARLLLGQKRFGGTKRSIHTKSDPRLKNAIVEIRSKRSVVAGEYEHGWCSGEDGEPPSLKQTSRHVICDVCLINIDGEHCPDYFDDCWFFEIEKKNLEKITNNQDRT